MPAKAAGRGLPAYHLYSSKHYPDRNVQRGSIGPVILRTILRAPKNRRIPARKLRPGKNSIGLDLVGHVLPDLDDRSPENRTDLHVNTPLTQIGPGEIVDPFAENHTVIPAIFRTIVDPFIENCFIRTDLPLGNQHPAKQNFKSDKYKEYPNQDFKRGKIHVKNHFNDEDRA